MKIAAFYDIHGNAPALAEVRDERVDLVVVGGDVLPGPYPVTARRMREQGILEWVPPRI